MRSHERATAVAIKIWKYSIPGHCEGRIRQVLQINVQYGKPVVWVMLDDDLPYRSLDFYKVRTGLELTGGDAEAIKNSAYIGTVKDEEGRIDHCFCIATQPENPPVEENNNDKEGAAAVDTNVEASIDDRVNG